MHQPSSTHPIPGGNFQPSWYDKAGPFLAVPRPQGALEGLRNAARSRMLPTCTRTRPVLVGLVPLKHTPTQHTSRVYVNSEGHVGSPIAIPGQTWSVASRVYSSVLMGIFQRPAGLTKSPAHHTASDDRCFIPSNAEQWSAKRLTTTTFCTALVHATVLDRRRLGDDGQAVQHQPRRVVFGRSLLMPHTAGLPQS